MSFNSPFTGNVIQPTDVSYSFITLTTDLQLTWPINGTTADDAAARIMEVSTASSANELWMPPANQASVGQDALIRNVGSVSVTVKDYTGANTIVTVAAGQAQYIYITTNATTAGTWGIIAYGIGSSGADAATLAGYGLLFQLHGVDDRPLQYLCVDWRRWNADPVTGIDAWRQLVHVLAQQRDGGFDCHWNQWQLGQRFYVNCFATDRLLHHCLQWFTVLYSRLGPKYTVCFYSVEQGCDDWLLHLDGF